MILIFGAGNIGLSFVGQIFARSGYRVVFADANASIVERLAREGSYTVELLHPAGERESHAIGPVEAFDARDEHKLADLLGQRPLIATAVGARAFPLVLGAIERAAGLAGVSPASLDIIAAENIHDPRAIAAETLGANAPGVHACSVGKMVPLQTPDPAAPIVVRGEAFNTLIVDGTDWRTTFPADNGWLQRVEMIEAWMDRKLYVHNLGHAACAWRARAVAPEVHTIAEAIAHPEVRGHVEAVMHAAAGTVALAYPGEFTPADLSDHVNDLLYRFGNAALGDTVARVGRDVQRKLGSDERVKGALRLAEEQVSMHPASSAPQALLALGPSIVADALAFD